MADDPNRDLLPVKEGSCIDTCRGSAIESKDTRDRHAVVKLDRFQLEDRYLRMLDEILELKKLSNTQEDKIKRLATKLMRASAAPRSCLASALDFHNDKNRNDSLELENAKLKDKITVLRSQVLNHKITGRSSSQSRRLQICPSSGPTTCRSDIGRIRSSSSHLIRENDRENEKEGKNYLAKIEELEMEKKEMLSRIENLETEIANHEAGSQRQKVAENVEFIRVWRQMKLQNEELVTSQARNVTLEEQIRDLKELIDEKTRNNKDITTALLAEKKKFADMDEQLARAKNSQLNLREKDEQIRDLMNEMKILHQHNTELIALSSKYSNVEVENVELRKKISEQLSDHLSLKSAFSNEQANITALQAANEQLMAKLHELQRNIDTLTIQLKSFQSQNERQERTNSERRILRAIDRQTSTNSLMDKMIPSSDEDLSARPEICQPTREIFLERFERNFVTRAVQTEDPKFQNQRNSITEVIVKKSSENFVARSPLRDRSFQHDNGNLTPEEMINLLEKAQINSPLDVQNVARIRRIESTSTKNSESRQSSFPVTKESCQPFADDPWQILLILYKFLRENDTNSLKILETAKMCVNDNDCRDENNNTSIPMDSQREAYFKKPENIISDKRKNGYDRKRRKSDRRSRENFSKESLKNARIKYSENLKSRTGNLVDQYTETSDCCCDDNEQGCTYEIDCGYSCAPAISVEQSAGHEERFGNCQCDIARNSLKNFVSDFSTSIQKTFDDIHNSRLTRVDRTPSTLYKSWPCETRNSLNRSSNENPSKFTVCRRAQCYYSGKKNDDVVIEKICQNDVTRVKKNFNINNQKCIDEISMLEDLPCVSYCKKNCGDGPIVRERESRPILITDDQGLLEIHIICLQLASMATGIFRKEKNINDLSLFVSWDIWNQETAITKSLKYPKFNFNSSSIHRVSSLFEFFERVLRQLVSFRIHISHREKPSRTVARAHLSIKDILNFPESKHHYVTNFSSILPCSRDQDFGQLSLWIRLSCHLDMLEMFKKQNGIFCHSLVSKKISKINNEEKMIYRSSLNLNEKKPIISLPLNGMSITGAKNLHSDASLTSENADMGKDIFKSSQMDNKNISSFIRASRISRLSKDSGSKQFNTETSSLTLERSLVNDKTMNNTFSADSYLTISREALAVKHSDSSIIRAMEHEDTTSEELHDNDKTRDTGSLDKSLLEEETKLKADNERFDTSSVNEFNNFIRNGTILSPRESRSSVQDLGTVFSDANWQKYRRRSMATQAKSLRPSIVPTEADNRSKTSYLLSNHPTSKSDAMILRIESLSLFQSCPLLDDPTIHRLYVEFTFLGYHGVELETISVTKPTANSNAYFNYMRKFEFDAEEHPIQRNIMRSMMTENDNPAIKFIVVSEPLLEEMETKECVEVGYAYFNIRDHIMRGRSKDVQLTIINTEQTESIGILKITLLGAKAIRRCMSEL